jgi:DNA replication protein DnaC
MSCARCGGTGFEIVERDGREYAHRCACRSPAARGAESVLAECRLPPRYEECSLANFEPINPGCPAILKKCMDYCSGYPYLGATTEGLGLLFTGGTGVGKTHLAVAILKELVLGKGARGQFWDFHSLIREIRNCYNPDTRVTEVQFLQPIVDIDVLVLDDLGAWKMTDWMVDTLFYIINSRYIGKRSTIITTNLHDEPARVARDDDSNRRTEYLVERVGQPLRSRLTEMCLHIRVGGEDYRQVRQESNTRTVLGYGPVERSG